MRHDVIKENLLVFRGFIEQERLECFPVRQVVAVGGDYFSGDMLRKLRGVESVILHDFADFGVVVAAIRIDLGVYKLVCYLSALEICGVNPGKFRDGRVDFRFPPITQRFSGDKAELLGLYSLLSH